MNNKEHSIGFVILTWNSEKYIEECILSIEELQTYFNVEISVFDNGSVDKTLLLLDKLTNDFKNIKITRSDKNIGTTKSRNIAHKQLSSHDFYCVLDSDTKIINLEEFVNMVEYLCHHESVGIIGPVLRSSDNSLQYSAKNIPLIKDKFLKLLPFKKTKEKIEQRDHKDYSSQESVFETGYLMSACLVISKACFDSIGGFDERIFYAPEDVEYCLRAHSLGYKVCYYQKCTVLHYWQRISRKKIISKHNFEHIKGLFYVNKKYKSFLKKNEHLIYG